MFYLLTRKKIIIAAIVVIIILFVLSVMLSNSSPQPTNPPSSPLPAPNISSRLNTTSFPKGTLVTNSAISKNFPTQLTIYQNSNSPLKPQLLAQQMASNLSLNQIPQFKNIWISQDKAVSLFYDALSQQIIFTSETPSPLNQGIVTNLAITEATSFIETILPSSPLSVDTINLQFKTGSPQPIEAGQQAATLVIIPFTISLDNLPVFYDNQPTYPIEVWVNSDNKVIKAVINPLNIDPQPIASQNTHPIEQVIDQIKTGDVTLLDIQTQTSISPNQNVVSLNVKDITIQYRLSATTNTLYPYYHLTGTATLDDNNMIEVELISLAVNL